MAQILHVNTCKLLVESLAPAVAVIRAGGVVAYPTETFYGLGVDALKEQAVRKIYAIKERDFSQPLLVLIPNRDVLPAYVRGIPECAPRLMETFWPGPLTMIFYASSLLSPLLCGHTGKVALRISSHPIAQVLVETLTTPLTATSANRSGFASLTTADQVMVHLGKHVDVVIDGGKTPGEKASTIIDLTTLPPQLVREGIIPWTEIKRYF